MASLNDYAVLSTLIYNDIRRGDNILGTKK